MTRASLVRPKVQRSVHYCNETKQFHTREYRDVTSLSGLPTGSVYPTRDESGNLLSSSLGPAGVQCQTGRLRHKDTGRTSGSPRA